VARGRVQGVGYRASAAHEARRLGVRGWVRNQLDGTVEVLAEGDESDLSAFLEYLRRGPSGARVRSVDVEWLPAPDGSSELGPFETR
jgi:acylphosphatase